jgi:hypothetical protein
LEGIEIWSAAKGLLYSFDANVAVSAGDTATVVGQYNGTPPAGFFSAGIAEGADFLLDGERSLFDTLYLVDTNTGEYIAFSYGDPPQSRPLPAGFTGTVQVGSGESFSSDAPNGTSFARDATGGFAETTPTPGVAPCYAPGTMIDTPDGPRAIETLRPGDLVAALDHGPQPIRWIRSAPQALEAVSADAKPVFMRAGALGPNLPARDMIVSPQHRILVGGRNQLHDLFASEVFVPAKSLCSLPGVRHMKGKTEMTWIHFACDRHEVVRANGGWSESLLLGPMTRQALSQQDLRALDAVLPPPKDADYLNGPPARPCLTVSEVSRIMGDVSPSRLLAA